MEKTYFKRKSISYFIPTLLLHVLVLNACKSLKIVEPPVEVALRIITQHHDSCKLNCSRYVFSKIPCERVVLKDKHGRVLPNVESNSIGDSACFTCSELDKKAAIMNSVSYEGKEYNFNVFSEGYLQVFNGNCSKPKVNLLERFKDSNPSVVFWHRIDTTKGKLIYYTAQEAFSPPYYVINTLDSVVYDLINLCTNTEQQEEREAWQSLYTKHVKVQVTPNPFDAQFDLTVSAGKITHLMKTEGMKVTFYDDQGIAIGDRAIELDKAYNFVFPQIASGKIIYYRVTWSDYFVAGQIAKR